MGLRLASPVVVSCPGNWLEMFEQIVFRPMIGQFLPILGSDWKKLMFEHPYY